jgi:hypothetical protein
MPASLRALVGVLLLALCAAQDGTNGIIVSMDFPSLSSSPSHARQLRAAGDEQLFGFMSFILTIPDYPSCQESSVGLIAGLLPPSLARFRDRA